MAAVARQGWSGPADPARQPLTAYDGLNGSWRPDRRTTATSSPNGHTHSHGKEQQVARSCSEALWRHAAPAWAKWRTLYANELKAAAGRFDRYGRGTESGRAQHAQNRQLWHLLCLWRRWARSWRQ